MIDLSKLEEWWMQDSTVIELWEMLSDKDQDKLEEFVSIAAMRQHEDTDGSAA